MNSKEVKRMSIEATKLQDPKSLNGKDRNLSMEKDRKLVNDKDRKSIIENDRKSDCSVCGFSAEGIKQLKTHLLLKHPGMKAIRFLLPILNYLNPVKQGFATFFILCPPKPKNKKLRPPKHKRAWLKSGGGN